MTWEEAAPVRAFIEDPEIASETVNATWNHHSGEVEE
jgi:hypothetical protein